MFTSILKDLFYFSNHTKISRLPYFTYKIIIFILLINFVSNSNFINVLISLSHTYININIGAKRVRHTGGKGSIYTWLTITIYILCTILIAINGDSCDSPGVALLASYELLAFIALSLIPPAKKQVASV
jgi:uncharacterized membrane protein YhaH (DUF805 family)